MADAGQESSEGISVSKPVARVMMLANAAVWGSGYTMLKHVQENMPTQWMMFFRMASAALLMAIVFFPTSSQDSPAPLYRSRSDTRVDLLAGIHLPAQRT